MIIDRTADALAVPGAQVGERVVLTAATGSARHAGVLLPPLKDGEPHRVHTDKGRVLRLDGTLLVAPERSASDRRRDRRRQYCDDGRPIYRYGDLPSRQLATRTMLRQQFRRRPADEQEPIASYMAYKGYAPLYAVADAEKLPALPPARKAAWDQARTCARCNAVQATPYAKGVDDRRYCSSCLEPAAAAWWYGERVAGRVAAGAWAADLLADVRRAPEKVALVYLEYPTSVMSQDILAETWDGEVLLSARVCESDTFFRKGKDSRPADLAAAFRNLSGRRLISWRGDEYWLSLLQETMREHSGGLGLTFAGGHVGPHWDEWRAERNPHLVEPCPFRTERLLHRQEPPSWRPPELLAYIRHAVTEMATRASYWWRATCLDTECGLSLPFGSSTSSDRWAERHHRKTGHIVGHTTEPGTTLPDLVHPEGRAS
ncbi:hypothetical protein ABT299_43195 [Spirillospora sp. NPDC000708]